MIGLEAFGTVALGEATPSSRAIDPPVPDPPTGVGCASGGGVATGVAVVTSMVAARVTRGSTGLSFPLPTYAEGGSSHWGGWVRLAASAADALTWANNEQFMLTSSGTGAWEADGFASWTNNTLVFDAHGVWYWFDFEFHAGGFTITGRQADLPSVWQRKFLGAMSNTVTSLLFGTLSPNGGDTADLQHCYSVLSATAGSITPAQFLAMSQTTTPEDVVTLRSKWPLSGGGLDDVVGTYPATGNPTASTEIAPANAVAAPDSSHGTEISHMGEPNGLADVTTTVSPLSTTGSITVSTWLQFPASYECNAYPIAFKDPGSSEVLVLVAQTGSAIPSFQMNVMSVVYGDWAMYSETVASIDLLVFVAWVITQNGASTTIKSYRAFGVNGSLQLMVTDTKSELFGSNLNLLIGNGFYGYTLEYLRIHQSALTIEQLDAVRLSSAPDASAWLDLPMRSGSTETRAGSVVITPRQPWYQGRLGPVLPLPPAVGLAGNGGWAVGYALVETSVAATGVGYSSGGSTLAGMATREVLVAGVISSEGSSAGARSVTRSPSGSVVSSASAAATTSTSSLVAGSAASTFAPVGGSSRNCVGLGFSTSSVAVASSSGRGVSAVGMSAGVVSTAAPTTKLVSCAASTYEGTQVSSAATRGVLVPGASCSSASGGSTAGRLVAALGRAQIESVSTAATEAESAVSVAGVSSGGSSALGNTTTSVSRQGFVPCDAVAVASSYRNIASAAVAEVGSSSSAQSSLGSVVLGAGLTPGGSSASGSGSRVVSVTGATGVAACLSSTTNRGVGASCAALSMVASSGAGTRAVGTIGHSPCSSSACAQTTMGAVLTGSGVAAGGSSGAGVAGRAVAMVGAGQAPSTLVSSATRTAGVTGAAATTGLAASSLTHAIGRPGLSPCATLASVQTNMGAMLTGAGVASGGSFTTGASSVARQATGNAFGRSAVGASLARGVTAAGVVSGSSQTVGSASVIRAVAGVAASRGFALGVPGTGIEVSGTGAVSGGTFASAPTSVLVARAGQVISLSTTSSTATKDRWVTGYSGLSSQAFAYQVNTAPLPVPIWVTGGAAATVDRATQWLPLVLSLASGASGLDVSLRMLGGNAPGSYLDFSDYTVKLGAWSQPSVAMQDIGQGYYQYVLDLSLLPPGAYYVQYSGFTSGLVGSAVVSLVVSDAQAEVSLIRKSITNRMETFAGSPGTLLLYDDDDVTIIGRWPLRDSTGGGISAVVTAPAKRGKNQI
jgi:hypothetical protein